MPEDGPFTKREAVLNYGGEVTLCDGNQKAREETTKMLMDKRPMQLIHSSDNYLIIAGQSTVSYEIYKEIGDLDYIITPLGGGGLLAGSCIGTINFSPKTKTIGVEPELANDGYLEFKKNRLNYNKKEETLNFDHKGREIPKPKTIADGLRINVGRRNSEIMNHYLDDIITVDEDEIRRAMQLIWERMKIVVEPSSATTLAAVIKEKKRFKNKNVVLVLSGGNIDMRNLPFGKEKVCLY